MQMPVVTGENPQWAAERCLCCRHRLCTHAADAGYRHRTVRRGDRLQTRAGACMRFWIIIAGTAASCATLPDGRRQIVQLEMPGDLVCGLSSAHGMESWVEFLGDGIVCEVDLSEAVSTLRADAGFYSKMFRFAHARLESALVHVVSLGRLDSMERLCLFLVEMAQRTGVTAGAATRVSLALSREDIADYLGLNAETVSRLMGRIKKSGLAIFLSPTEYAIPDMAALERRVPIHLRPTLHDNAHAAPVAPQTAQGATA